MIKFLTSPTFFEDQMTPAIVSVPVLLIIIGFKLNLIMCIKFINPLTVN